MESFELDQAAAALNDRIEQPRTADIRWVVERCVNTDALPAAAHLIKPLVPSI